MLLHTSTVRFFLLLIVLVSADLSAQPLLNGSLSGIVTNDQKEPLIGAYLQLLETNRLTVSNPDGSYRMDDIPYGDYVLRISYVGEQDLEIPVSIVEATTQLDITMSESVNVLRQATVTAKSNSREQQEQAIQIESVELRQVAGRVKDVSEVIERLPGVNVRGSGSFGDRVDISLNGLNGTAVRTYLDGLPLEFILPQLSINNIPVNVISRVDVYKGVIPIDVGTDALGGGINVITNQSSINELNASYSYGSFNTHQASLSGNYQIQEDVSIGGHFTYNYSDNNYSMDAYVWEEQEHREINRFHDAYRLYDGSLHFDLRNKKWADRFRFTANYNQFYKEQQNGGTIENFAFGEAFYEGGGTAITAKYDKQIGSQLDFSTIGSFSQINILYEDTTANLYSWSGQVIANQPRQRGELTHSRADRDFNNVANRINLKWSLSPYDELLLTNLLARQSTIGRDEVLDLERDPLTKTHVLLKDIVGLQYSRKLFDQKLELSAAAKYYFYDLEGVNPRNLEPQLANGNRLGYYTTAKYTFSDRFFVRASFENALRVPTAYQFFGNGGNIRSNVELKPELSDNLNLGFSYASSRRDLSWILSGNGFIRLQEELIFLQGTEFQRYFNADAVETAGLEGSLNVRYQNHLRLDINATILRQVYSEINGTVQAQAFEGTDFPNVPKWFYNARLTYEMEGFPGRGNSMSAYTQYKYVDRFNFLNVTANYDPAIYIPVQQRVDIGIQFYFQNKKYGLALNANNIFDADIFDNFSVPRPGRNYNFRLSYRLNNFSPNNQ